jgi:hypothetical protein
MLLAPLHQDCFRYSRHPEEFPTSLGLPIVAKNKLNNKNSFSGKDLASTLKEFSTRL